MTVATRVRPNVSDVLKTLETIHVPARGSFYGSRHLPFGHTIDGVPIHTSPSFDVAFDGMEHGPMPECVVHVGVPKQELSGGPEDLLSLFEPDYLMHPFANIEVATSIIRGHTGLIRLANDGINGFMRPNRTESSVLYTLQGFIASPDPSLEFYGEERGREPGAYVMWVQYPD